MHLDCGGKYPARRANSCLHPTARGQRLRSSLLHPSLLPPSDMDTFFRRHFKRKEAGLQADAGDKSCRQRRPSVAVPTSKARRRSSVGLPSSTLMQRRRSSVQVPAALPCTSRGRLTKVSRCRWAGQTRRRSSTTTPNHNPRFAVCRKKVAKLRTIDTHLLGPSMLLASLIQMAEEDEDNDAGAGAGLPGEQQVEVRDGVVDRGGFSRSSSIHSDGSDCSIGSCSQSGESQLSEAEQPTLEEVGDSQLQDQDRWPSSASSLSEMKVVRKSPLPSLTARTLIKAPRCLRRNSSQTFVGEPPFCGHRHSSTHRKRRKISTISKAGSPWPGRGPPLPSRKNSVYYLNHPAFYRGPGALGAHGCDSPLESWSGLLLYVVPDFHDA